MKNLFYVFSVFFLKYRLAKNLITCLTIILILLPQYACNTTGPDEKPPVEPDSTTQNFTFETYEFGDGFESSWLNDVWIFDENNIWAVGYINSTSNSGRVNIIKWNGNKWLGIGRQFNSAGIDGIWAKDTSNIYFATGIVLEYKNGMFTWEDFSQLQFDQGQAVHKLWGSSESNIWGVGPWGTIVHFNGNAWSKVEFDQQWSFFGITGNKETGVAYAVGRNNNFTCVMVELNNSGPNIIYISGNSTQKLKSYDVDTMDKDKLILAQNDIWTFDTKTNSEEIVEDLPGGYYLPVLSAYTENDIYFWGNKLDEGEKMLHYNGKRVMGFSLPAREYVIHGGAHAIKDLAAMAASSDGKGYLILAKRK
jgi:hypothetical protein